MQLQLNDLAQTGMQNQLRFLDFTDQFHEKMRLYFYPKIFKESPVMNEKWADFKVETYVENTKSNFIQLCLPLVLFLLLFVALGSWNFYKKPS
ncbi:MAG: DUF3526 domain-containing protein, partial [Leadbetterella sp.]